MKKLICCKSRVQKADSMEKLESNMEKNRMQEKARQERTANNIQILRDDLYQGIMKPFFAEG
jgi:hypothetical protein